APAQRFERGEIAPRGLRCGLVMSGGPAPPEGPARYAQRFASTVAADNYRRLDSAGYLSSLGLGTYLGREDAATDSLYRRAIGQALQRGLNLIDTAVNSRHQRTERQPPA